MSTAQDGTQGPSTWLKTPIYRGPIFLDGYPLDQQQVRPFLRPGQVRQVPLLAGTSYAQQLPGHPHAPEDLAPLNLSISEIAETVSDFFITSGLLSRAFDLWVQFPIEERWRIRPDGRTVFTLSRPTAGAVIQMQAGEEFEPSARISDWPVQDTLTDTALTVIASGGPSAGEILIDPLLRTTTVTTADLTAEETGARQLIVKHWPLRRQILRSIADEETLQAPVIRGLNFAEIVEARSYDDVVQP